MIGALRLRIALRRYGWGVPLGLLMATVASVLGVMQRVAANSGGEGSEQFPDRAVLAVSERRPVDVDRELDAWIEQWPQSDDSNAWLGDFLAQAKASGIVVDAIDVRHTAQPTIEAMQVEFVVPVRGTYPRIRDFAQAMLLRHPTLALDTLAVRTGAGTNGAVESSLRFSGWFRDVAQAKVSTSTGTKP